jgi:hypothetical protein
LRRTAEFRLEKPVVAINTATYRYRYAPRLNGDNGFWLAAVAVLELV